MHTFWKKAFALMLAAIFIFGITPASNWLTVLAAAEPVSGTCGAEGGNLTWSLDPESGELSVSGTGDMTDYDEEDNLPPWAEYTDLIQTVTIGDGVTSIGECAFNGCMALEQIAIGTDVARISADAFAMTALTVVYIPASVEEIGLTAFVGMTVSGDEDDEEITPTLEKIDVDPTNAFFSSADGVLYDKTQTTLIQYPCGKPVRTFAIPDSVTEIADMAFPYCVFLEELTMPEGLTTIDSMAFFYSFALESVTIPGTVTTFGEEPFLGCLSLRSVTFENGVTQIPEGLFTEFDALESVTIPGSVTTIGAYAFAGCASLADLTLGSGVEVIDARAFYGCESLADLVIPDSVSVIAESAFAGCAGLTSLTIGAGVETVAAYAFSDCPSLTSLTFNAVRCSSFSDSLAFVGSVNVQTLSIGSGVTMIPSGAFLGMKNVTSVVIPDSVTAIGAQAFQNCRALADVTVGNGLETIGDYAFRGCAALTNLHIPSGVTAIGAGILDNCDSLSYICSDAEDGAAKAYAEANGIAFRLCDGHGGSAEPNTVSGVCGAEGDNVTWTLDLDTYAMTVSGMGAMADYTYEWFYDGPDDSYFAADTPWQSYSASIRTVTIGNGVTHIGANAFRECEDLTDVTMPDSLTSIGESAFGYCAGVTSVTIPGSVEDIGDCAFMGTSLQTVSVPAGVQQIGLSAFSCFTVSEDDEITTTLEAIDVDPANAFYTSEDGVLYNKAKTTLIQYPCAKASETFEIPDSVTALGDSAFAVSSGLAGIRIPDSVTTIGEWCFNYCPALTSVTIPDSVTELGGFAFAECLNLERVTIGSGVSAIGESAFSFCEKLTDVTIGSGAQVIGDDAFSYCASLAQIVIPANVTTIGEWAFAFTNLTTVTLPDGLAGIAENAFASCANLASAHIPAGVTTIGDTAFADCPNLAYICCDTADCLPRTYAEANGVEFRLCAGHESGASTVCGVCGAEGGNVLWALNLGNGKMILSGAGAMADYADAADVPWADYRASIQTVTVQSGVTNIGDLAFCGCTPLSDVTIGEDVTRIGARAFDSAALTDIAVPAGVTEIGKDAFACGMRTEDGFTPTLRGIEVDPENTAFSAADGVLYDKAQTVLILYPAASPISLVEIPDTVIRIADGAFRGGVNLMNVHIPYSVTEIGEDAFADCGVLGYICCDIAGSYAETYAAQNDIPFRFCDSHNDLNLTAGDANADGVVDLKDAVLIRRYLAGGWGDIRIYGYSADVDADGVITLQDVALIVRYLAGGWGVVL